MWSSRDDKNAACNGELGRSVRGERKGFIRTGRERLEDWNSLECLSFSFASGAEVGKPAPAAGDRRELKQETPSQGENPGGVERAEGGAAGTCPALPSRGCRGSRVCPPGAQTGGPDLPSPPPALFRRAPLRCSTISTRPPHGACLPWAAKEIDRLPAQGIFPAVYLLSTFRNEKDHTLHR
ncbi:hypothetical protein H920_17881 [Fukomys damarensis]|uniref:Uncharacterized protein n=1 Tax=Fukomys damarensis TaxID=885580 RepID=A0A091CSA4_FUKDA|nr:hypothetical protein H920_17881 [Fukomys damarensis]